MDFIFTIDIVVNFRTIFLNERTQEPIKDPKIIARHYILKGRFFIDVLASFPIELIADLKAINISRGKLKLIGLLKLTRMLRLGRIVTFLKMGKSIKHSI
jgi:hypothetical protein